MKFIFDGRGSGLQYRSSLYHFLKVEPFILFKLFSEKYDPARGDDCYVVKESKNVNVFLNSALIPPLD